MKLDRRYGPHRVAAMKKHFPHGKVQLVEVPPLKGEVIAPMPWESIGLKQGGERKAA